MENIIVALVIIAAFVYLFFKGKNMTKSGGCGGSCGGCGIQKNTPPDERQDKSI